MNQDILHIPLHTLVETQPLMSDFLRSYQIEPSDNANSFLQEISQWKLRQWNDMGITRNELIEAFNELWLMAVSARSAAVIHSIDVLAGHDKNGHPEACNLHLVPGEITCIVGPTGSGKSRLLADIEWLANADTPTGRKVLINGALPDETLISGYGGKLVAQITQNMNFVLDMDVESFLLLHAQSRFLSDAVDKVAEVIDLANALSGETFKATTPVTFLSGGQSRALMIADVACIGQAPIVLIDEIENAGVDKKKALDLLVSQDKIVLMASHDPLLILKASRRVVIKNGGMDKILEVNDHERKLCQELEKLDDFAQAVRQHFRLGNALTQHWAELWQS